MERTVHGAKGGIKLLGRPQDREKDKARRARLIGIRWGGVRRTTVVDDRKRQFIALLFQGWSPSGAAREMSITPSCMYRYRVKDAFFAQAWSEAMGKA